MHPQISDKELMQIILDQHKHSAERLTQLAMECSDFNLRNEILRSLDMCFKHQDHIFELMQHLGWYQTTPASPDQINSLRNMVHQGVMA